MASAINFTKNSLPPWITKVDFGEFSFTEEITTYYRAYHNLGRKPKGILTWDADLEFYDGLKLPDYPKRFLGHMAFSPYHSDAWADYNIGNGRVFGTNSSGTVEMYASNLYKGFVGAYTTCIQYFYYGREDLKPIVGHTYKWMAWI